MQNFISKFKNSHLSSFILISSYLYLSYMFILKPEETPMWVIQITGCIYFIDAICWILERMIKNDENDKYN